MSGGRGYLTYPDFGPVGGSERGGLSNRSRLVAQRLPICTIRRMPPHSDDRLGAPTPWRAGKVRKIRCVISGGLGKIGRGITTDIVRYRPRPGWVHAARIEPVSEARRTSRSVQALPTTSCLRSWRRGHVASDRRPEPFSMERRVTGGIGADPKLPRWRLGVRVDLHASDAAGSSAQSDSTLATQKNTAQSCPITT